MRGGLIMKLGVGSLLLAGGLALSFSAAQASDFKLASPAAPDNGILQTKEAGSREANPNCVGQNVSPPLAWSNVPDGTKSFALVMFDPEAQGGTGVSHMVIYGIPASVTSFAEGELSQPSDKYVGGKNGAGMTTYGGPCPPPGTDWHHYTLIMNATDLDPKDLQPGMTREELLPVIKPHAKATAGLILRFRHPEE
jgi:Raf kinase inhibitor-like YbhB/YbcL family protein